MRVTTYYRVNTATGERAELKFDESHARQHKTDFNHGLRREDALELVNLWNRLCNSRWIYFI